MVDEEQLLELWDGEAHQSARVGGDRSYSAAHVSITGGIQDEVLTTLLAHGDGGNGKWARFLFSPLPPRPRQPRNLDPTDEELNAREDADYLMKQLAGFVYRLTPKTYRLDRAGLVAFDDFDRERADQAEVAALPSITALYGKSAAKVLRITGLLHLLHAFGDGLTTPDDLIPPQRVRDAIQLVRYFDAWALSFHTLAASPQAAESDRLLRAVHRAALKVKSKSAISWTDLRRNIPTADRKGITVNQGTTMLCQLEEMGLGKVSTGKRGGAAFTPNGKPWPN